MRIFNYLFRTTKIYYYPGNINIPKLIDVIDEMRSVVKSSPEKHLYITSVINTVTKSNRDTILMVNFIFKNKPRKGDQFFSYRASRDPSKHIFGNFKSSNHTFYLFLTKIRILLYEYETDKIRQRKNSSNVSNI